MLFRSTHTSLDNQYASTQAWHDAQVSDNQFISTYAESFPNQEDMAESFLPYVALRYRSNRISASTLGAISSTIPARIAFFDQLVNTSQIEMKPIQSDPAAAPAPLPLLGFAATLGYAKRLRRLSSGSAQVKSEQHHASGAV